MATLCTSFVDTNVRQITVCFRDVLQHDRSSLVLSPCRRSSTFVHGFDSSSKILLVYPCPTVIIDTVRRYGSLALIPHVSICLIFAVYSLVGISLIREIESNPSPTSSPVRTLQHERERLLSKIIDKRQIFELEQYTRYVYKHLRQYEEEVKKNVRGRLPADVPTPWTLPQASMFIGAALTTIGKTLRP